jgi:hypothetical protein
MAIKTFTTGEVLTAADTNTFLTNAGLVYVTQATFTTSTAVQVNNVFTSTYPHYRVIIIITTSSQNQNVSFQLSKNGTPSATGYGYGGLTSTWGAAATGNFQAGNATTLPLADTDSGSTTTLADITLYNPQTTAQANYRIESLGNSTSRWNLGRHGVNDAMDGFKLYPNAGNITGSYIIYGQRTS